MRKHVLIATTIWGGEQAMRAYELATQNMKDYIHQNGLQAGDRLPSERRLCELLHVSRKTLRKVLADYERNRLIDRRGQAGTYLKALPSDLVAESNGSEGIQRNMVSVMFVGPPADQVERQRHLQDALQKRGKVLHTYFSSLEHESPQREKEYLCQVLESGACGVILQATPLQPTNERLFAVLSSRGVRVAHLYKYQTELPAESFFLPDMSASAVSAISWLVQQGAKHVALITPLGLQHPMVCDVMSVRSLVESSMGIQFLDRQLPWADHQTGTEVSKRMYSELPQNTGLLCMYSSVASRVANELRRVFGDETRLPMVCIDEGDHVVAQAYPIVNQPWLPRALDAIDYVLGANPMPVRKMYSPTFVAPESPVATLSD